MSKLDEAYQSKWASQTLYDRTILTDIGRGVQLHTELDHVLSSAAACLNVLGAIRSDASTLANFLNSFGLQVDEVVPFPSGCSVDGEDYDDKGHVIFEWIGPGKSPLNERGGKRGQNRTSIDAYVLCKIGGRLTQVLIEWKFSETYPSDSQHQKFGGARGVERARRYALVLTRLRKAKVLPFRFSEEGGWGFQDLGYEPLYQLLRMTLLAKTTTPLQLNPDFVVSDYRILHLTHSDNSDLNTLSERHLRFAPSLAHLAGSSLHNAWRAILADVDAQRFFAGYRNNHLAAFPDPTLRAYLVERYE